AAGRRQQVAFPNAASEGCRPQGAGSPSGRDVGGQRRARGLGCARPGTRPPRAAFVAATSARGARPALLRRPFRSPDRRRDGHQHGRGEEPRLAGRQRPARTSGALVMTFPRDPDSSLEELLRSALVGEADAVSPAGDGLARIQARVSSRRSRRFWLRPVVVVGAAAVVGGAGFTAYALTAHPDSPDSVSTGRVTPLPSTPATIATASVSPTSTPVSPAFPSSAFYPFTSAAAELSWEAQKGAVAQPWITD